MTEEVVFIHAADLHLDSPFSGLSHVNETIFNEIKNSTFTALNRLVTNALELQVDFVLITGDLFDNETQSLKAQILLRDAFEKLNEAKIAVYLSFGNHDYIKGNKHQVTYPENVHVFPDEKVRSFIYKKAGAPLASISGFSYVNRKVVENKTSEYDTEGIDAPLHIAMLHGSIQGNTEHDTYAPFLLSELASKDFDYWALGHIHKRSILKTFPYIVYPGNIQGRHRKETGEKGCYLVRLSKTNTELDFIPLHAILFTEITIDVSACNDLFQLENAILEKVSLSERESAELIELVLKSDDEMLRTWEITGKLSELIDILNEKLQQGKHWQYIYKQSTNVTIETEKNLNIGIHFTAELERLFSEAEIAGYLTDLYEHKQARKYLQPLTKEEEIIYLQEAKARLLNKLHKGEGG